MVNMAVDAKWAEVPKLLIYWDLHNIPAVSRVY